MSDLAKKWDTLDDLSKSNLSYRLAGTRQTAVLKSLLQSWDEVEEISNKAANSSGTALDIQSKHAESLNGHLQELQATGESVWNNVLNSDELKGGIDLLNGLLTGVDKLTSALGGLGTLALGGGAFALFKNVGSPKCLDSLKCADIISVLSDTIVFL